MGKDTAITAVRLCCIPRRGSGEKGVKVFDLTAKGGKFADVALKSGADCAAGGGISRAGRGAVFIRRWRKCGCISAAAHFGGSCRWSAHETFALIAEVNETERWNSDRERDFLTAPV
ncbi:MAG: hypothetical protein ACLRSW_14105 [Christensenellaceae bacterium]